MKIPSSDAMRGRLDDAIAAFLANDLHLLRVRTSERSMCHKLAESMQPLFRGWNVDCEYNRDDKLPKVLPAIAWNGDRSVYPDIIVHRRGTTQNLLVVEAKCSDSPEASVRQDEDKLDLYRAELYYHYSALITFEVGPFARVTYDLRSG